MDSIYFDSLKDKVKKEVRRGNFIAADGKQINAKEELGITLNF